MNKLLNLILENLKLHNATVTYNDFQIDPYVSFELQKWSYKQDLLQINAFRSKKEKYTIDVGWYPDFNPKGSFSIEVIKGRDWDNPLFIKKTNDYNEMKKYLQEALDYVKDLRD